MTIICLVHSLILECFVCLSCVLTEANRQIICDLLRDNLAHPTKIDFLLEAIIVTKVTF